MRCFKFASNCAYSVVYQRGNVTLRMSTNSTSCLAAKIALKLAVGLAALFFVSSHCGAVCWAQTAGQAALGSASDPPANGGDPEVIISLKDGSGTLTGRIVTQLSDGQILFEEPSGSYVRLLAEDVSNTKQTGVPFVGFDADQTAAHLQQLMGQGQITTTAHFVICSAASPRYTQFCGQLLERVADEFPVTLKKAGIELPPLPNGLAVLIFATSADLKSFAEKQHPEVDFSDTPGYYSVTHNQILFSADRDDPNARTNSDITRRLKKTPRVIETMVHETVHLLQYNSGLMNRFAANPTWLAEGMAVYFEPANSRSSLLWSRSGDTNQLHLAGLKAAAATSEFQLPFTTLLADDQTFSRPSTVRNAYAESWGITWALMKRNPEAYGRLLKAQNQLRPLIAVSDAERISTVEQALGMSVQELESVVRKAFRRQL